MNALLIGRGSRKGRAMAKALCYGALGVGGLMALIFVLDLIVGAPFGGGPFATVDILGFLASLVVAYLGWNALRDLK
jgi:hypothetical protein